MKTAKVHHGARMASGRGYPDLRLGVMAVWLLAVMPVPGAEPGLSTRRSGVHRRTYTRPAASAVSEAIRARPAVRPFLNLKSAATARDPVFRRYTRRAVRAVLDGAALRQLANGESGRLLLPAADGEVLTAAFFHIKRRGPDTVTFIGRVVGHEHSDVLIVWHDGALSGSVALYDEGVHYQVSCADGREAEIRLLDNAAFTAECGTRHDLHAPPDPALPASETAVGEVSPPPAAGSAAPPVVNGASIELDVVVGYGREARQAAGGTAAMEARIVESVERMNTAFTNSLISDVELVLLGTVEDPDYDYPGAVSGDMGTADELGDLNTHGDGNLDAVSQLRIDLGADLNVFVIKDVDGSAGVAYVGGRSCVVASTYMTSSRITFAHELGHNLGCLHAWGDTDCGTSGYRYAWRLKSGASKYRTIMAYDWGWQRIPWFSNPQVTYNGAATGAVPGYDATGDATTDSRFVSGGYSGTCGAGFDGSNPDLAADCARYIADNASSTANRASRAALAVTAPTGVKSYVQGTTCAVTWVGGIYDDTAALDLYKGAGLDRAIAGGLTNNTRRYDWVIPMDVTPGSDYRVRVTLNGAAGADSAAFTVNPAFVDLAVGSPYGVTDPATGVTSYAYGSMVTGAVLNSPVMLTDEQGRVSLVCTGWVGTGSAPVAGEGTNLVFSITEDSSLDWLWAVQDLVMSNRTVTGSVVTQALDSITAGDGYRVDPGGDVTFEAGRLIRLVPGFEAATGSVFRARTP